MTTEAIQAEALRLIAHLLPEARVQVLDQLEDAKHTYRIRLLTSDVRTEPVGMAATVEQALQRFVAAVTKHCNPPKYGWEQD